MGSAEKQVWLHLLDLIRNGLIAVIGDKAGAANKNVLPPRIPHLVTAFLIRSTRVLSNPLDPMFKSISSFVLAKPMMDLYEVPEFLRLFHSNDVVNHTIQQDWILNVIHDGLRDELDFGILQQNFIPKMLMSFHDSSLARSSAKSVILDIICKMTDMANPIQTLIRQHSLLLWLMHVNYD